MADTAVQVAREIFVIATRGEKKKTITTDAKTVEDLLKVLRQNGYSDLDSFKLVESVNRHTLEHPTALLPAGRFGLYLMPKKSKGGAKAAKKKAAKKAAPKKVAKKAAPKKAAAKKATTPKSGSKTRTISDSNVGNVVDDVKKSKEKELDIPPMSEIARGFNDVKHDDIRYSERG